MQTKWIFLRRSFRAPLDEVASEYLFVGNIEEVSSFSSVTFDHRTSSEYRVSYWNGCLERRERGHWFYF